MNSINVSPVRFGAIVVTNFYACGSGRDPAIILDLKMTGAHQKQFKPILGPDKDIQLNYRMDEQALYIHSSKFSWNNRLHVEKLDALITKLKDANDGELVDVHRGDRAPQVKSFIADFEEGFMKNIQTMALQKLSQNGKKGLLDFLFKE